MDRDLSGALETREVIVGEGLACEAIAADVTVSNEVRDAVRHTLARFGRIDVLHNNVGITEMGDPVELSEEGWHRGIDVNLTSAFLTTKHVLPTMEAQGKGAIRDGELLRGFADRTRLG